MDLECVVGSTDLMLTCSIRLRCEMPVRVGLLLSFSFRQSFLEYCSFTAQESWSEIIPAYLECFIVQLAHLREFPLSMNANSLHSIRPRGGFLSRRLGIKFDQSFTIMRKQSCACSWDSLWYRQP